MPKIPARTIAAIGPLVQLHGGRMPPEEWLKLNHPELLEDINAHGSIGAAASQMGLEHYGHAPEWLRAPRNFHAALRGIHAELGRPPAMHEIEERRRDVHHAITLRMHGTTEEIWRRLGWPQEDEVNRLADPHAFVKRYREAVEHYSPRRNGACPGRESLAADGFSDLHAAAERFHGGWEAWKREWPTRKREPTPNEIARAQEELAAGIKNGRHLAAVLDKTRGLVRSIAIRYRKPGIKSEETTVAYDDLMQEGTMAIIHAIDKYDFSRKTKFSTFITPWIIQFIQRSAAEAPTMKIPLRAKELVRAFQRAEESLAQTLGRMPKEDEVHKHLGWNKKTIESFNEARNGLHTASLSQPASEEQDQTLEEITPSKSTVAHEAVERHEKTSAIARALDELNDRDRQVIEMRFGLNGHEAHTLAEIAQSLGLTRERVRQIESRTLIKLRSNQAIRDLRETI